MSRQRQKKGRPVSGWLVLDKPVGIGSTECVSLVKRLFRAAKVGHAGTLDPLASGMLPIALGEATKTVPYIMDGLKTYRFIVGWGTETNTDDLEGSVTRSSTERPDRDAIQAALEHYVGEIEQVPPSFSAVKINGERAYKLARAGDEPEIAPRIIYIDRLEMRRCSSKDETEFECRCGKGTYVRAIARDIGRELGCFGHVGSLRRIGVGPFIEDDLVLLAELEELAGNIEALDALLLPTGAALDELPEISVSTAQANRLRAGNSVVLRGRDAIGFAPEAVCVSGDELVAIGAIERGEFQPRRVFRFSGI
jgi:tRNA pseudouridine55 synthase